MKVKVYKPNNANKRFHKHAGDTFRELIDLWKEHDLVDVVEYDGNYCWFGNVGETLLYDRPTYEWMDEHINYEAGLFGNPIPINNGKNNSSWIFWGRSPRKLHEKSKSNVTYEERNINSIFIGKIENQVQAKYRSNDWESVIEKFDLIKANSSIYKYTQDEYLEFMSKSKYGLSMRGYGPKCNREIELFALGVVPLLLPDVDISYANKLEENVHYFRVKSPEDVTSIVKNTTKEQWEKMSIAGKKWYDENCSPIGSFNVTKTLSEKMQENIEKLSISKPSSVCTFCTDKCIDDLDLLLKSMNQFNVNVPIFLICDSYIDKFVKNTYSDLNIKTEISLDRFSGKNRKQMEQEGIFTDFVKLKCKTIDFALSEHKNTLYVDADIVFFDHLPDVETNKKIGLCPHYIRKSNTDQFGYFNSGMIYVNTMNFTKWWYDAIDINNTFYEQSSLNEVPNNFSHFEFDMTVNFGWWRLLECNEPELRINRLDINKSFELTYNNKKINSLHTHFKGDTSPLTLRFNDIILKRITGFKNPQYNFLRNHLLGDKVVLLCQYYNDKNEERQKEIDVCFRQNLQNPKVKTLISFTEKQTNLPDFLTSNEKFVKIDVDDRMTYKMAVDYANEMLPNQFVGILNGDIFLDFKSNWNEMHERMMVDKNLVFAQSRTEFSGSKFYKDSNLNKIGYAHSQDSWFFISPMYLEDISFYTGTPGCDNAFAERMVRKGYVPINSPNEFKTYHYDVCRGKDGSNYKEFYKSKEYIYENPESRGYYLVPDIDMTDTLFDTIKFSSMDKYKLLCDLMSKKFKINNQ